MDTGVSAFSVSVAFVGGLAVFLYGMRMLSGGLKKAVGPRVRGLITRVADNRYTGILAGALATLSVQSSSMVMLTLIGLVQSQLLTTSQSLAIMLGAEIGTTAMAQLVAFSPGDYGLPLFASGFLLTLVRRPPAIRHAGEAIAGVGLLFFGLRLMGAAVEPLRDSVPFRAMVALLDNPLAGLLAGMGMTALMQSSGAFIGMVMMLAHQGSLTLETAIPLLLGANIGTCITAGIGSIGTLRAARRVFLAQVLFNVVGVVLFMLAIPWYADLVRALTLLPDVAGTWSVPEQLPRQIANAHTLYNLLMAVLFLPVLPLFSRLLHRLLPDDPEEQRRIPALKFLNESALANPMFALRLARIEVARMNKLIGRMASALRGPFLHELPDMDVVYAGVPAVEGMRLREEKIDFLEREVTSYLIRISREELDDEGAREAAALLVIVKEIEAAGDVVETLLEKPGPGPIPGVPDLTDEGRGEIMRLHRQVCGELAALTVAIEEMSFRRAGAILAEGRALAVAMRDAEFSHMRRMRSRPESEMTHDIHMELAKSLERIHHSCMHIAETIRTVAPEGDSIVAKVE